MQVWLGGDDGDDDDDDDDDDDNDDEGNCWAGWRAGSNNYLLLFVPGFLIRSPTPVKGYPSRVIF